MRKLVWAAPLIAFSVTVANVAFIGCGSEADVDPLALPTDDAAVDGTGSNDGSATGELDAAADAFIDAIVDGGRDPNTPTCKPEGASCASSGECCTANCHGPVGATTCSVPVNDCRVPGTTCTNNAECCTSSCIAGACADKQCVADNKACATDGECCGGSCVPDGAGGGTCKPLNPTSPTSGNPCAANTDCVSTWCNGGICANPSFCSQNGDVCATSTDCCGGVCTKSPGASLGTCGVTTSPGATQCVAAGTVCAMSSPPSVCGGSCCSRSCAPFGPSGIPVCQPESGCRLTGALCLEDTDCCGAAGTPDGDRAAVTCRKDPGAAIGRCDNGNQCSPAGAICRLSTVQCNATDRCCQGTVQVKPHVCQQDALGIPRCMINPDYDCAQGPPPAGTVCASSADCCGNPCLPNASGVGYVCGGSQCVARGGVCSSNSDCCTGLPCAIPPGAPHGLCGGMILPDGGVSADAGPAPADGGAGTDGGTADGGAAPACALYGQQCGVGGATCCDGVPCLASTGGVSTCHFP